MKQKVHTHVEVVGQIRKMDDEDLLDVLRRSSFAFANNSDECAKAAKELISSPKEHALCLQNIASAHALVFAFLERIFQKMLDLEKQKEGKK